MDEEGPGLLEERADDHARAGDYAAAVALRERAFSAWRARGEVRRAAYLAAYQIAFDHLALFGNQAVAQGWLARGARLAEEAGECAEAGWVALARAMYAANPAVRGSLVDKASRLAKRYGDVELQFDALAYTGLSLVEGGRVSEGMRYLDEAATAARAGEVANPVVAGEIYCKLLVACESTLDVRRAEEWHPVAAAFGDRPAMAWASAICRMHYGGVLIVSGRWEEAEHELAEAVRLYDASYRALRSAALVRLAELRVRQGRLGEARELLAGQTRDGYAVRPWARMEWHRAGNPTERATVAARLERMLDPEVSGLLEVPVLALLTEMQVACGNLEAATRTVRAMRELTAAEPVDALVGLCPAGQRVRRRCRRRVGWRSRRQGPGERDRCFYGRLVAAGSGRREATPCRAGAQRHPDAGKGRGAGPPRRSSPGSARAWSWTGRPPCYARWAVRPAPAPGRSGRSPTGRRRYWHSSPRA